jgi:hypothetical protein
LADVLILASFEMGSLDSAQEEFEQVMEMMRDISIEDADSTLI